MIKKEVFQITVDLKSLQIKIAITDFVFIKLLQNVYTKWHFKNLRFYKNILLNKILSDPFTFTIHSWDYY